jgi:transcriptional regulator with XRE-family HTH domain
MTQEVLAERIGTTKGTISRWEAPSGPAGAHRAPSDDALGALADALDINKEDLFRDPARPSLDILLRDVSLARQAEIIDVVRVLLKRPES